MDAAEVVGLTRRHESTAVNTFALGEAPPVFVRGEGPWLVTEDGRRCLDLACGSAVTVLGHGHPAHRRAIAEAAATGILHTGTRLPSPWRAALYERLAALLPPGLDCFHLVNAGAEAIETAIKAAQYVTGRRRILAFEGGYHGRTLGALSATWSARLKAPFATLGPDLVGFLPYPYPYRADPTEPGPERLTDLCLAAAAAELDRPGAEPPACLIVEAVQGVGGVVPAPARFLLGLSELARTHGVVLVADEIWSGFGRTGAWFSFEHAGITPDLVVIGKALSGGLPLAAVAGPARILKAWPPGMHTSTFQGNPLACAMALATIRELERGGWVAHAHDRLAPCLRAALAPLAAHPRVRAVRVVGAEAAVELVTADGRPDAKAVRAVQRAALARDVLAYGGGWHGNALMLVPPLVIDPATLAAGLARVREALAEAIGGKRLAKRAMR
jgi:4-aminobutyrate aminotransferase-like enzyme